MSGLKKKKRGYLKMAKRRKVMTGYISKDWKMTRLHGGEIWHNTITKKGKTYSFDGEVPIRITLEEI